MNVGTYLLLTVPLVGGSLYAYDNLRSPAAPTVVESGTLSVPPVRPEPRPAGDGPTLSGDPTAQTEKLVRALVEQALRDLRGKASAAPGAGVVAADGAPPAATVPLIDLGPEPLPGSDGVGHYDEKTLKVFRAYLNEAQRLEREERMAEMIGSNLDRLGVSLNDTQRKSVVDITMRYQNQRREAFRTLPPGQDNREARQKASQEAHEAYSKAIYDAVPAAEAEKIVNAMGQFRGGGFDGGPAMGGRARPQAPGAGGESGRGGSGN